ncbi:NADH-quinone oxidoreductase subunit A [Rubrolithibacter danxiaensis]|uniref:NADH-quinone oxidoreductase subunit A n=1 Tax=Rubrolithibacter danxiaensis TaxID=3390805 RepID=UPI003BF783DB
MQEASQLTEFGKIFIFLIMGILLVLVTFFVGRLIAPRKPNPEKLTTYECGEDPSGNSWLQFNSRFYVIALVFLLFDVEMVFIFPWSTVFGQSVLLAADSRWGWFTLAEMFIFVGILLLGLVYVWRKGDLEWIRPQQKKPAAADSLIPLSIYERINTETYVVKPFSVEKEDADSINKKETVQPAAVVRPAFKPLMRKTT